MPSDVNEWQSLHDAVGAVLAAARAGGRSPGEASAKTQMK